MGKKATVLLLALLALGAAAPQPSGAIDGFALGAGFNGAVALTRRELLPAKAQAAGSLALLIDIPLYSSLFFEAAWQLHGVLASSLSGGFQYRGHWGNALRLAAGGGFALPHSGALSLELGASAGASLNVDRYALTRLSFFYPGVFLEPYLELYWSRLGKNSFKAVLPLDWYFRKDLEISLSIGIGLQWRYYIIRTR